MGRGRQLQSGHEGHEHQQLNTSKVVFGTFPKYAVTGFDEQNQPIRQSYRYKVEEVKYQNEATLPFSVSYSPADGFVTTEGDANTSTTVTVTNNKLTSEKEGLYRFNVAKQWLDASRNPADKPTPEGTKARITVTAHAMSMPRIRAGQRKRPPQRQSSWTPQQRIQRFGQNGTKRSRFMRNTTPTAR